MTAVNPRITYTFELQLSTGKFVTWEGFDGADAARRYVAAHPEATVNAYRTPRHGFRVGLLPILKPGTSREEA